MVHRNKIIFVAFLAIIVDAMGFGLVYPLMTELFAGEQGFHMAQGLSISLRHFYLGLSFLLYPLAAFFGAPLMNALSDRFGRKTILVLCMGGITVSFFLMGLGVEFFSITLLLIARALSGIMAGSQALAQSTIIDLSTPQSKTRNLTMMTFILSVGIVLGPLVGGIFSDSFVVFWFTLSTPFYLAAILGLITTIWILTIFPHAQSKKGRVIWLGPIHILIEGFKNEQLRPLAIIFLCMQIGFSLFFQLIQIFVATFYDFESWEIGLFNGYLGIAFALALLFVIKIFLKYLKVESLAFISLLVTGIFLILPMIYPLESIVWIMAFLAAGFNMIAYGSLTACFSSAKAMDVFASIMLATWAITGFSINLISILGLRSLITIGGFFMLLAALLMRLYNRKLLSLNFNQ